MLLTKRKSTERRLVTALKAAPGTTRQTSAGADLLHEKQLAVVDAVEWAVERWASRDLAPPSSTDPRAAHAARLIAALMYLDPRFERLEPAFVTQLMENVASAPPDELHEGPRLDAKAAAALLTVEVGAFRR
jgi:hypothetical protein